MSKTLEELIALNVDHDLRVRKLVQSAGQGWLERRRAQDRAAYQVLLSAIPLYARKATLELGAGYGGGFDLLAVLGFGPLLGLEIVFDKAQQGQGLGRPVEWGDMADLGRFEEESFDCVVSRHSLEHTDRPRDVVAEVWRVLRPGGYTAHVVPAFAGSATEPAHLTNWTWEQWRQVWHETGFLAVTGEYRDYADRELHMVLRKPTCTA